MNNSIPVSDSSLEAALREARAHAEHSRVDQAAQSYARIFEQAPDNIEALRFLGLHALTQAQNSRAIELLKQATALEPENAQLWKPLGLAYFAAQQLEQAQSALSRALTLAPENFIVRLQLGEVQEALGRRDAALRSYFGAISKAQSKGRWRNDATTAPNLRELVRRAMGLVDAGRRQLYDAALAPIRERYGDAALARVQHCLDIHLDEAPPNYPDPRQRPKFLYFPDLPTTAYFPRDLFPWYAKLEANTDAIRAELLAILDDKSGLEPFLTFKSDDEVQQYLGGGPQGAPAWDAFFFYRHGVRNSDNCGRCPRTSAILDALPLVGIRNHAPEVCFSVLTPGTHILPHRGVTNTRVVTHLPLIVPEDCAIKVGGEMHAWQEGQCVTFDDTFEHEAWNRSQQTRVVLILDVWNPYLSEAERAAVTDLVEAISTFNRESDVLTE